MKSSTYKVSVGFVGFLEEETPAGVDAADAPDSDSPTNVGFSESPPKPDKRTRQQPDKAAAAEVSARLDAERRAGDKAARRGHDSAKADDAPFTCPFCNNDPARCAWCGEHAGDPGVVSCRDCASCRMTPATPVHSIIATCQRYGVALRIDPSGDLVVGKAGARADEPTQPWPSLLDAIEAHIEAVARLVEAGWTLKADYQGDAAA